MSIPRMELRAAELLLACSCGSVSKLKTLTSAATHRVICPACDLVRVVRIEVIREKHNGGR